MSLLACVASFAKYARSFLFKSEDILSQSFCIESKEITFKDLINQSTNKLFNEV